MTDTRYFGGTLIHQRLPVFEAPPGPSAPALKRLRLPQGDLAQLHNGAEPIHFLAWLELKPGGTRGNHVHRVKKEFLYLLHGAATLTCEEINAQERVSLELVAGDLVIIEPGIAHAIRSPIAGQALEFSPSEFDPNDTIRYEITGKPSCPPPPSP